MICQSKLEKMVGKLHKTALLMQTSKNFTNFITGTFYIIVCLFLLKILIKYYLIMSVVLKSSKKNNEKDTKT